MHDSTETNQQKQAVVSRGRMHNTAVPRGHVNVKSDMRMVNTNFLKNNPKLSPNPKKAAEVEAPADMWSQHPAVKAQLPGDLRV